MARKTNPAGLDTTPDFTQGSLADGYYTNSTGILKYVSSSSIISISSLGDLFSKVVEDNYNTLKTYYTAANKNIITQKAILEDKDYGQQ